MLGRLDRDPDRRETRFEPRCEPNRTQPVRNLPDASGMTVLSFQMVVDAHDPHAQADWWAETLGWEVEPQDEAFIRSMLDQGFATEADTTRHRGRLVWKEGAAINAPSGVVPGAPRMLFVAVPEAKSVKNRVHIDLRPGVGGTDGGGEIDVASLRAAVEARGAVQVGEGRQGSHRWVVMQDPEGNEFCI